MSNIDKPLWPEGYTKGDMIRFYADIFPILAPHLAHRPLVVTRWPNGIAGKSFYQKNAPEGTPSWVDTYPIYSEASERTIHFVICDRLATVVWLANQACIEFHPWMSRTDKLNYPDFIVFDLDPSEGVSYEDVCDVADVVKEVLTHLELRFYVKTSGATGLHIYLPIIRRYSYEHVRDFAGLAADLVARLLPQKATIVRQVKKRGPRVYVDYLQNIQGKTVCSPYSLRPVSGAPVSTPLRWEEIRQYRPSDFDMETVPPRLKALGDLFAPVKSDHQNINKAWDRLKKGF
ncbi:MAG: non-homologous end-joining DNA ligase [Acidobacteriota bacterium]